MKKHSRFFYRLLSTIIFCMSAGYTLSAQALPSVWQDDMQLTITTGGGMRDHTHTIFISGGNSYESNTGEGDNDMHSYTFSGTALNGLISLMKKKHFEKMKAVRSKHLSPDMETTTIELNWNGKQHAVSTGASMEVAAPYKAAMNEIYHYIYQMMADQKKE